MKSYIGDIPNTHIRDYQRKRLYKAEENCTFWNTLDILSLDEIDKLITLISEVFNIYPPKLEVGDKLDIQTAYATKDLIVLPFPITKSLPFICHEMSHVINYQIGPADHHGPNFASAYMEVVKTFIGQKECIELEQAFKKFGGKYKEVIPI